MAIEICPPFAYMFEMLDKLKEAGVIVTIASSKRRNLVEVVLDHHNIAHHFKMVIGAADVTNHKPHPESVHITLDQLQIDLSDAVVIGDSIFDLDMAKNAGVDAIGVTTGLHNKEMLQKSEPLHIVEGLHEVLPIILNGRLHGQKSGEQSGKNGNSAG
jgi:phosphoglycolate phosphatase